MPYSMRYRQSTPAMRQQGHQEFSLLPPRVRYTLMRAGYFLGQEVQHVDDATLLAHWQLGPTMLTMIRAVFPFQARRYSDGAW